MCVELVNELVCDSTRWSGQINANFVFVWCNGIMRVDKRQIPFVHVSKEESGDC